MEVTDALVQRVAELAKLRFDAQEMESIKQDLKRMIDFVDQLNDLDTDGEEPLIFVSPHANVWRDDQPGKDITQEEALRNAPKKDSDYFKVPKVMGREEQ
ncbi:MAG TPA: Asp-tRNA(Asn)/Glu-tRNA(Gln) amidotransferase subunit GatC [Luteibaculaceae bacterium]|nr:Asp-tRNA(Asn)/Glu-tRNA(Gln) amidotransferase subunit GatC [Luteibaculaceae bacterium]